MKKISILIFLLVCSKIIFAQADSLITWGIQSKTISQNIFEINAKAQIPAGWYVYAINKNVEGLEDAVSLKFDYENAQPFDSIQFKGKSDTITNPIWQNKKVNVYTDNVEFSQQIKINGVVPAKLKTTISFYLGRKDEFLPAEQIFEIPLEGGIEASADAQRIKISSVDLSHPQKNCGGETSTAQKSIWHVFLLGFLGGLIALLTPCVFPMMPVTVSFFTKRSANRKQSIRNGVLYGFFIFLIYVLASIPFHILGNVEPEIFNTISTNALLNIIFFIIFLVFAFSFFGFFDITLPSSIAGKADSKSGLGSIPGIFFMALTLAIVSFSCTGPILGSLLVGSLSGGAWQLTGGLAGFGVALGVPFALFAIFPHWLQALPKSGGWLDTVKKILAFLELALAFKFLSNADLVMHWGLLKREVFIAIWALIAAGLALYLFGVIHLPHDFKGMKISRARKIMGIVALLFTLYLIPGITQTKYANLQLLSGFPPPLNYSVYGMHNAKNKGLEANVMNDYDKALQLAKEQNKLVLIDFTGWACVNCRKMEENVWTQPQVSNYIKENFILVSLYVDDRQLLPVEKRFTYKTKDDNNKDINTLGDKWATFEAENFNQVTQPLYVILNTDEKLMNKPVGYTPDASKYRSWLQCGNDAALSK